MLVTGIDVGLSSHDDDAVKVMNVDVNEYPEQSAQDLLADLKEVLWKGNTCEERTEDNCFRLDHTAFQKAVLKTVT